MRALPLRLSPHQAVRRASPISRFCRSSRSGRAAAAGTGGGVTWTDGPAPGFIANWQNRGSSVSAGAGSAGESVASFPSRRVGCSGTLECPSAPLCKAPGLSCPDTGHRAEIPAAAGPYRSSRKSTEPMVLFGLLSERRTVDPSAGLTPLGALTSAMIQGRPALARVACPWVGPLSDQEEAGATRTARPWILLHHLKFSIY